LSAVRSLGRRGIEVIAADEYPLTPGAISRYAVDRFLYPSPVRAPEAFLESLADAIEKYRPRDARTPYVLMPVHSETSLIAEHADRFEGAICFALASSDAFRVLGHKARFWRFSLALGMRVPDVWFPHDTRELKAMLPSMKLPVFVKHPQGLAGVGVVKARTVQEVLAAFEGLARACSDADSLPLVQTAVPGEDYCATALCDRGRICAALSYRNVYAYPRHCGPGVIRETVHAPRLLEQTRRLVEATRWHGFIEVDFRWTGHADDSPYLLEVNPRFCSGMPHAIHSGVDYPWLEFQLAAGKARAAQATALVRVGARTQIPVVGSFAKVSAIARAILSPGRSGSKAQSGKFARAFGVWRENRKNASILLDRKDMRPIFGLLYPLAVFLRHGSMSRARVVGAETATRVDSRQSRR
jgi:predicted ATP-grasp superfamily ATP-dependent carboligase